MAQNLLKFMDFDSEIMFGNFKGDEPRAYIVFQPEGKNFKLLYGPMNPITYKDNDNLNRYGMVGISIMTNDQYDLLKNGATYNFEYNTAIKIFGKAGINYTQHERIYSLSKFLNKEEGLINNIYELLFR